MAGKAIPTERAIYTPKTEAFWRFPSKQGDYILFEELAPAATQSDLAKISGVQSVPAYFEVFRAMYDLRNSGEDIEKARLFVREVMRTRFPNTLTRVAYMPEGNKDIVMHGYGTSNRKERQVEFVGRDGEIQNVSSTRACLALTGKKPDEVKEIMDWLNGTSYTGLWRVNAKPIQREERVVRFVANSDGSFLYCDVDPAVQYPAFRVSRKKF